MLKQFYNKYLARDRLLRHVYQHLEIMVIVALYMYYIAGIHFKLHEMYILLFFTFLPDLDGISSSFIWYKYNPAAKGVVDRLLKGKIKEALSYGTKYHKKLNRLLIHNVIAYPFLWFLFIQSIKSENYYPTLGLSALLGHLTFDMFDDIFQLGHIKNMLWPFYLLFPKSPLFDSDQSLFHRNLKMKERITVEPIDYLMNNVK